jgi:hypothetical protein
MRNIGYITDEEKIETTGRVFEIIIPNPEDKRRYPRAGTIYGVAFNTVTGEHYAFNRDYVILPIQLDALPVFKNIREQKIHGWGPNCPIDISQWRIVGGESGSGFMPMNPDWARRLRDQCHSDGMTFFYKQDGGHLLDGVQQYKWPLLLSFRVWKQVGNKSGARERVDERTEYSTTHVDSIIWGKA